MDFVNATAFPADLARATLPYRDLMLATVVVKCAFEVSPDGEVSVAAAQAALHEQDQVTPYGTVDGDLVPIKSGCDLAVLGCARPFPPGKAATELDVGLRIGDFTRHWRVFGDRRWRKSTTGFHATTPEPFTEMTLGYDKAYGGKAIFDRRFKTPYHDNPDGKGYVVREQDVDGSPLPNLENADQLIKAWTDQPQPAGLGPLPRRSMLRGARGYRVDAEAKTAVVEPLAFSFSHPRMMMPAFPAGAAFELTGMGARERLAFTVPPTRLSIEVRLGAREHELELVPDTLCVFADDARFHVIARRAFVYQFIAERLRRITVRARAPVVDPPALTIHIARSASAGAVPIAARDDQSLLPFDELLRRNPMTELVEGLPVCASG